MIALREVADCRLGSRTEGEVEGPAVNSHTRSGRGSDMQKSTERRRCGRQITYKVRNASDFELFVSHRTTAAPSVLNGFLPPHIHALAGVGINCRPFGPQATSEFPVGRTD